jgi:hypothetical protein
MEEQFNSDSKVNQEKTSASSDGALTLEELQSYKSRGEVLAESRRYQLTGDYTHSGKVFVHITLKEAFSRPMMLDVDEALDELGYRLKRETGNPHVFTTISPTNEKIIRMLPYLAFEYLWSVWVDGTEIAQIYRRTV